MSGILSAFTQSPEIAGGYMILGWIKLMRFRGCIVYNSGDQKLNVKRGPGATRSVNWGKELLLYGDC